MQNQGKQRLVEHIKRQVNTKAGRKQLMMAATVQVSAGPNAASQFPWIEEDGHQTSVTE